MKNKKFARILSWLLVFTMILSLQPFSAMPVKAAEGGMNVTLHFDNSEAKWEAPVISCWGVGETTTFSNAGEKVEFWSNTNYYLSEDSENDNWYKITITGPIGGFLFTDYYEGNPEYQGRKIQEKPELVIATCADGTINDVYMIDGKWYLNPEGTEELKEPEISDDELGNFTLTLVGDGGLVGSDWDTKDTNNELTWVEGTSNYTITCKDVPAGTYGYKVIEGHDWGKEYISQEAKDNNRNEIITLDVPADVTITVDVKNQNGEHDVKIENIEFIDVKVDPLKLKKGETATLTATYYDGNGSDPVTDDITFATKEENVDGVKIEGNKVTVDKTVAGSELAMVATYKKDEHEFKKDFSIELIAKTYKVTLNVHFPDKEMTPNASDVHVWNMSGKDEAQKVLLTEEFTDEETGVKWLKGTIELPYNDLGLIAKPVAGNDDPAWVDKDVDQRYTITPNEEELQEITLWYVFGFAPVADKNEISFEHNYSRYLYFEYENKNLGDVIPQFYSWTVGTAGYNSQRVDFDVVGDGKYYIEVPVSDKCEKVDFCLVLEASDNGGAWVKDGGDHAVEFPLDQNVLFVKMSEGELPTVVADKGAELKPDEEKAYFYYRDNDALVAGTLADSKASVTVNGVSYDMEYNAAEKRFVASAPLKEEGRYYYYYTVDGNKILDKHNPNVEMVDGVEYSYIDYIKLSVEVTAEVMNKEFNYNENNVVKVSVSQNATEEEEKLEISKAYIDLSSLGCGSEVPIDLDLMAVTISAKYDAALGDKQLPVVVMDQFNNKYKTTVDVKLVERTKNEKDFDWDEAVIYFMLTDRFFDGNTANNAANGANTYGKDNAGLYHGGDFAGLTAKLDYLKDLGVNTIWISPIVENIAGVEVTGDGSADVPFNAAYHGYWASNFTKLNPAMGTEEEFKTLIAEAHNRGMKIMVDVVLNHAGYGAEANFEGQLRDQADVSEDNFIKGGGQSNLPDFVTEDPDVRAQVVKWQTDWMTNFDIDYYRVDTVKHVESTTWAAFKNALTASDSTFKMIGEYYGAGAASNGGTLGTGQMDSTLDFDFNDWASLLLSGKISAMEKNLVRRNAIIDNTYMTGHFLGSHDEEGFKQSLLNEGKPELEATALAMVAATLQITAKGQPVIYYGEELGQTGKNNYPYNTNRYDLDWTKATDDNATYTHYKKLLSIRNAYTDVFARGDRTVVDANDDKGYDIVKRTYADQSVWVAMNIKNRVQNVTISGLEKNASYVDLYSDTAYTADADGKLNITLPKISFGGTVILAKQDQAAAVTLDKTEATVEKGKELKLTATVSPDGAKDKTVVFTSDNEKVATVTADGVVKAIAAGTANITATTVNGKTATCKVTVIVPVKKIYLNQSLRMKKGDTLQLTATVLPADATDKLTWKSSNSKKVTVSETGKIKAVAAGSATITVTSESGKKTTCKVTVEKKAVKATKVTIKKTSKTMKVGDVKQLKLTVKPSRTTEKITFKSSKKTVISVAKNGVMTAKKPGKSTITVTVGKKKASITITVKQPATGIKLNKTSATLKKGKTLKLKATITPGNSTDKVTFKSSKKSVATVNSKGVVTAKKKGKATITAKTTSGKTAKCKITVK